MTVYIDNETDLIFDFPDVNETIMKAIETVAQDKCLPAELEVNVLITTENSIREINRENRGVDSVTDVLSFPYYDYAEAGVFEGVIYENMENILGDIIICARRVMDQAAEYEHSQKRELAFLTVHSMLHLTGYDHMEEADGDIMRAEEKRIMEILGIQR